MIRTTILCAIALTLAGCDSKERAAPTPATEVKPQVVEKTLPAPGGDTTLPASGTITSTTEVLPDPEKMELMETVKVVPQEKRMRMAVLLECEESRVPGGVSIADRPAFMRDTLAKLDADPLAIEHCRAELGTTPTTE